MSKKTNKKTESPEVENPQVEEPQIEQPETEQPEVEQPEAEQEAEQQETEQPETEQETEQPEAEVEPEPEPEPEDNRPSYVKELMEKGVVVIQCRSRGELDEKLAAIPSDVNFYTGAVGQYMGTGLYRIQVNLKK